MKAVIVIPTYNEADNIERLVDGIYTIVKSIDKWKFEILVVDSKSPDKTADIVKKIQKTNKAVHILETEKEGIGKAYSRGFDYALEHLSPDILFEMDADYSHDPKSIPSFIKKIEGGADFVIGSRYRKGGSIPKDWGLDRKLFSVLGNLVVRFGFMKLSITDWTGGYRAIRADVAKASIHHVDKYTGYVFQIALLDFAVKYHAKIEEVPIKFTDRKYGVSKINSGQYIRNIFSYIFSNSPFVKFVFVGLSGFVVDFGVSFILIHFLHMVVWISTIISGELAVITNFILNNYWAFSHNRLEGRHMFANFLKFNGIALGSIAIQAGLLQIATTMFGIKLWFVYKALIICFVIIPYSYFLYNKFIWKKR